MATHIRELQRIAYLKSPRAVAELALAQVVPQREIEAIGDDGISSEDIRRDILAFTQRLIEFAHTPEGMAAANHALDWEFAQGWGNEVRKKHAKAKETTPGLWEELISWSQPSL
ncbi:MAG: hypothetical protein ABI465_16835 [Ktedonobacteraceae bacterium]